MIFVDSNVWMYAVGRPHPLRDEARRLLEHHVDDRLPLVTSAEVLQEMLHAYLPVSRLDTLDAALTLATDLAEVWPMTEADVMMARDLRTAHRPLSARDLAHLSVCLRHEAAGLLTFDQGLAAAFGRH